MKERKEKEEKLAEEAALVEKKRLKEEAKMTKEFEEAEAAAIKQELAEKAKKDAKEKNNLDFKHDK